MLEVLNAVKRSVKDPAGVQDFMDKYEKQIQDTEREMTGEKKSVFMRAVSCVWYAMKKGVSFMLKHWRLVMLTLLVIMLFIMFGASGPGHALGLRLFGQGNVWNAMSTKLVGGMKVKAGAVISAVSSMLHKSTQDIDADISA